MVDFKLWELRLEVWDGKYAFDWVKNWLGRVAARYISIRIIIRRDNRIWNKVIKDLTSEVR